MKLSSTRIYMVQMLESRVQPNQMLWKVLKKIRIKRYTVARSVYMSASAYKQT